MSSSLRFLAGLALLLGAACSTPPPPWSVAESSRPRPYETLDESSRAELRAALRMYEAGELTAARAALAELSRREPEDIRVSIWYQEVRLAWAEEQAHREEGSVEGARKTLRNGYRQHADSAPGALAWVMAARLEDDGPAAKLLFDRALELDPTMSWAHYGLAHLAARAGDLGRVSEELERTFELEPDHLPALRLYAWAQAQTGDSEKAIAAFGAWLENSDRDLLATERIRSLAILDLALVHLTDGDAERAEELIRSLPRDSVEEDRRLAALAAAEQARGRPWRASEAAAAASLADPDALLPAVQQALLLELWLGDLEGARGAWRRVLEMSATSDDLGAGMQRFRAQVHLSRLRKQLEEQGR